MSLVNVPGPEPCSSYPVTPASTIPIDQRRTSGLLEVRRHGDRLLLGDDHVRLVAPEPGRTVEPMSIEYPNPSGVTR